MLFLLGVGLCFIPVVGYGEIDPELHKRKATYIQFCLLEATLAYVMRYPDEFLNVGFYYDPDGKYEEFFPEGVDTKGKIFVIVYDNRDIFSHKSGTALLGQLKRELEIIYSFIKVLATDMDTDIVALFFSEEAPLGYFYQGEYHLWEK